MEFLRLGFASAKIYFQEILVINEYQKYQADPRPRMRPYPCGILGCWCEHCGLCKQTDAIEYYASNELKYTEMVEEERDKALSKPLGIAFVTFKTVEAAEKIVEDYACSARFFLHLPLSRYSKELGSNQWIVKYAPIPDDINWPNLTLHYKMWYLKFTLVNFSLAIIVIVFTTPVYLFTLFVGPKQTGENFSRQVEHEISGGDPEKIPVLVSVNYTLITFLKKGVS